MKRYLFIIGVNEYEDGSFVDLDCCLNDAEAFEKLMKDEYGFDSTYPYFKKLTSLDCTRQEILTHFQYLKENVNEDDRVLIYHSGHGFLNDNEQGFWIPHEAMSGIEATYITNVNLRDQIKNIKSKHTLLITDSCFSGNLLVKDGGNQANESLELMDDNQSRWIFTSGRGLVAAGASDQLSPFTSQLIGELNSVKDSINIVKLADDVSKKINWEFKQLIEANPFHAAGHAGGQFIFRKENPEIVEEENSEEKSEPTIITKIKEIIVYKDNPDSSNLQLKLKKIIGSSCFFFPIALVLGSMLIDDCQTILPSMASYYHTDAQTIYTILLAFIGISSFLYDGYERKDKIVSAIIGVCALLMAFFPPSVAALTNSCLNGHQVSPISNAIHNTSLLVFGLSTAYLCLFIFTKGPESPSPIKIKKNKIFKTLGYVMLFCLVILMIYGTIIGPRFPEIRKLKLIFWFQTMLLYTSGVAWLVKGGLFINYPGQRNSESPTTLE